MIEIVIVGCLAGVTFVSLGIAVFMFLRQSKTHREHLALWVKVQSANTEMQADTFTKALETIKATNATDAANAFKVREQAKAEVDAYKTNFQADMKFHEALNEKLELEQRNARVVRDAETGKQYDYNDLDPVFEMDER